MWLRDTLFHWWSAGHGYLVVGKWELLVDAVPWSVGLVVYCSTTDISLVSNVGTFHALD